MKLHTAFGTLALLISTLASSQKQAERTPYLESFYVHQTDAPIHVRSSSPISAVAVKSTVPIAVSILDESENETAIPLDGDSPDYSYFYSFSNPPLQFTLNVSGATDFEYHLLHSGAIPDPISNGRSKAAECDSEPLLVDQVQWREGLPEPDYIRFFHTVHHNVVHHSAGSNTNTNYTQVVRDIYLYHTQVNGWSDIGYNYLIAQDGTIFAGRDPAAGSQGAVRGAHFCGANTGTLGICLLGNFETSTPTDPSWSALQSLLTFQLLDKELDPFESHIHPLGELGTIIGHRDGCSTLCPGEQVYSMLEVLKVEVIREMERCTDAAQISFTADTVAEVNELVGFQAIGNYQEFSWVFEGGVPPLASGEEVSVRYPVPGKYDVMLIGHRGISSDTVYRTEAIRASYLLDSPLLYPNPISGNGLLKIDLGEAVERVILHDTHGKKLDQWTSDTFYLKNLKSGMYFLLIKTGSQAYMKKLIIH